MLIVAVPPQELKDASKIANSMNLAGVRLKSALVDENKIESFFDAANTNEVSLNIDYRSQMKELIPGKNLSSLVSVEAKLTKGDAHARFLVQYQVDYVLPTAPIPAELNDKMFESFAKHNGLLNSWPYIRTQLNILSSEAGVPITLPLLKITPQAEASPDKKEA